MKIIHTLRALPFQKLSAVVAAVTILGACQGGDTDAAASAKNGNGSGSDGTVLTSAINGTPELSISSKLIGAAQLGTALDGQGSYTVFLPVDDAWKAVEATDRAAIESEENRPQLVALLRQHIAPGYVVAADLDKGLSNKNGTVTLTTMGAAPIALHRDGDNITLGQGKDAPKIVGTPIVAGNDVIYRIDRLIPPPQ